MLKWETLSIPCALALLETSLTVAIAQVWEGAPADQWVEARDAAHHSTEDRVTPE